MNILALCSPFCKSLFVFPKIIAGLFMVQNDMCINPKTKDKSLISRKHLLIILLRESEGIIEAHLNKSFTETIR